jgi:hypothetical protein
MNQQPDKFFSEKLNGYQKPAPTGAWNRIEASLEKKTTPKFSWWKIAASFLLLIAFGYAIRVNTTDTPPLAQKSDQNDPSNEKADSAKANASFEPAAKNIADNDAPSTIADEPPVKVTRKKIKEKNVVPVIEQSIAQAPVEEKESTASANEESSETYEESSETYVKPAVETKEKASGITLTITVDEANKYLDKNALAQATSEERKSSTFKKLLKKANDLKSNQDPFGDLREKKNEILALNFKNEKRGQNK